MTIRYFGFLAAIALSSVLGESVRADVVISIQSVQVAAGGSVYFDVTATANPEFNLDNFGLKLEITSANGRVLSFVDPQLNPHVSDGDYVLFGNSDGYEAIISGVDSTIYTGADLRADKNIAMPLGATARLLARIEVTTLTGDAPLVGDEFLVSVVAGTSFFDEGDVSIDFTANDGTITVTAVPEPATSAVLGVVAIGALFARRIRRKSNRTEVDATSA